MPKETNDQKVQSPILAFFQAFTRLQKRVFSWVFLQAIYILGMGLTSIFGRLAGKSFIERQRFQSTWKKHLDQIDIERMF